MPIIALITDFGTRDGFAGAMKGVIYSINPMAQVVDITHDISPGDISSSAFVLKETHPYFPKGTIFCVVVDPGVGSGRKALICKAGGYFFIGPDNGCLSFALEGYSKKEIRHITNSAYMLSRASTTFHGRDIFAPAAGHLSNGVEKELFGPVADDFVKLERPVPQMSDNAISGCIVYIDRFGNAYTNINAQHLEAIGNNNILITVEKYPPIPVLSNYAECGKGEPLACINSSGLLEISVNQGDAARHFKLKTGDKVMARKSISNRRLD